MYSQAGWTDILDTVTYRNQRLWGRDRVRGNRGAVAVVGREGKAVCIGGDESSRGVS